MEPLLLPPSILSMAKDNKSMSNKDNKCTQDVRTAQITNCKPKSKTKPTNPNYLCKKDNNNEMVNNSVSNKATQPTMDPYSYSEMLFKSQYQKLLLQ
eukprot:229069_1